MKTRDRILCVARDNYWRVDGERASMTLFTTNHFQNPRHPVSDEYTLVVYWTARDAVWRARVVSMYEGDAPNVIDNAKQAGKAAIVMRWLDDPRKAWR